MPSALIFLLWGLGIIVAVAIAAFVALALLCRPLLPHLDKIAAREGKQNR